MYIYCRITCRSHTLVESEAKNSDWFFFSLGLIKGIAALYENTHSFYLIGTFNCGCIFWLMEWILQCTNQLYLFSCQVCEVRAVWILYHPAVYTSGCLYTRYYHQYICFNEELISTPSSSLTHCYLGKQWSFILEIKHSSPQHQENTADEEWFAAVINITYHYWNHWFAVLTIYNIFTEYFALDFRQYSQNTQTLMLG